MRLEEHFTSTHVAPADGTVDETSPPEAVWRAASADITKVLQRVLIAACERLDLPTGGTKPVLFGRLQTHFRGRSPLPVEVPAAVPSAPTSSDEWRTLLAALTTTAATVVYVLFYATWCRACTSVRPAFIAAARSAAPDVRQRFVLVDVDSCSEVADEFGIEEVPTLGVISNRGRLQQVPTLGALLERVSDPLRCRRGRQVVARAAFDEFVRCDVSLREAVTSATDDVWAHRGSIDLYSLLRRPAVERAECEVDHVLEVQCANLAWCTALDRAPVASRAAAQAAHRTARDKLQILVNSVENLNVTTRCINQAKKGPFTAFNRRATGETTWKDGEDCLEDLARNSTSANVRALVEDGHWANIERALQQTVGYILDTIVDRRNDFGVFGQHFADCLLDLTERMKLNA